MAAALHSRPRRHELLGASFLRVREADSIGPNEQADVRAYLPLTHDSDVLAWRGLGIWNQAKPGEEVRFFELARLGDSDTLRGYRPYRFSGLDAVTSSLEYRHYFDDDFGTTRDEGHRWFLTFGPTF